LDHLGGVKLFIGNVSEPWRYNQEIPSSISSKKIYVFNPTNSIGSVISLMRLNSLLVICEVTVEGDCLGGNVTEFCNLTCGKCFADQPCNQENGTCPLGCDAGRKGSFCKEDCTRGYYGYNCNETCGNCLYGNTSCSITNGTCSNGCIAGWQGLQCNIGCVPGQYGYNCNDTCGNCLDGNSSCNTSNGHCNNGCMAGWQSDNCNKECVPGKYGYNCSEMCGNCLYGNTTCDTSNGHCNNGCMAGWQDDVCKRGCERGKYGYNCSGMCGNCLNGSNSCDTLNGNCTNGCIAGWQDYHCDRGCVPGTYSYNCNERCGNCLFDNTSCNTSYGHCNNGCMAGWQGDNCKKGCDPGKYGYNCNETCGHCLYGNTSCDKSNGQCINGCMAGWLGDDCKTECDAGTYGFTCNETCGYCLNGNSSCLRMNGHCKEGCQSGWKGETCNSEYTGKVTEAAIEISILGGTVGGAVAVVILVLVIVIIIFRRRRRTKSPSSGIPRGHEYRNVYENSTFVGLKFAVSSGTDVDELAIGNKQIDMPSDEQITDKPRSENPETYYNILNSSPRGMVSLSDLWDYVQEKCLDDKHFAEEFEALPSGPQLPTNVALLPENRKKNRYKDLYAYDVNRVQLTPLGSDENDYINASFIDGYSNQRMYIASQGTTKQNLNDFWRMLWQYDVEKIVMLTGLFEGGKHKCELYWPEHEGQTSTFGCVSVTLHDTDLFADYVIRTLEMSVCNKSKRLMQFHYTAWPDKGVPRASSPVVLFWNRVNREPTNKPIVVHCSAGIGRTGTYIALDILVSQGRVEGNVNVSACVSNIRRQRVNMVQTKEQYIFLHETLVEALMLSGTATTSDKFPKVFQELLDIDDESGKLKLQLEYERLQHEDVNNETVYASISTNHDLDEADSQQEEFAEAKRPENKAKNRYENILPADRHRVVLNSVFPGRNDYINAVLLPSHRMRQGFILTQMPLTGTVIDFWRMIRDLEVRTIVMLNAETSKAHDVEDERFVTQFQLTNWPEHVDAPENTTEFLEIFDIIGSCQNEEKPIIVHCLNGAERSGLYCVISTVIERLKLEKDVAITQTIKRMRVFRHQIIPNYKLRDMRKERDFIQSETSKDYTYFNELKMKNVRVYYINISSIDNQFNRQLMIDNAQHQKLNFKEEIRYCEFI
ncbi:hypothetical protein ACJMK2_032037, partial [Sinanodonta woodiana]